VVPCACRSQMVARRRVPLGIHHTNIRRVLSYLVADSHLPGPRSGGPGCPGSSWKALPHVKADLQNGRRRVQKTRRLRSLRTDQLAAFRCVNREWNAGATGFITRLGWTPPLITCIRRGAWRSATLMAQSRLFGLAACTSLDKYGESALHWALYLNNGSVQATKACLSILRAAPDMARRGCHAERMLPLHVAAWNRRNPLPVYAELLAIYPVAAVRRNSSGETPRDISRYYSGSKVVVDLLSVAAQAVSSTKGQSALTSLLQHSAIAGLLLPGLRPLAEARRNEMRAFWPKAARRLQLDQQLVPRIWAFLDAPIDGTMHDRSSWMVWWDIRGHVQALRSGRLLGACSVRRASIDAAAGIDWCLGGQSSGAPRGPCSAPSVALVPPRLLARSPAQSISLLSTGLGPCSAASNSVAASVTSDMRKPRRHKFPRATPFVAGAEAMVRRASEPCDIGQDFEFCWLGARYTPKTTGVRYMGRLEVQGRSVQINWQHSSTARLHKRRTPLSFLARELVVKDEGPEVPAARSEVGESDGSRRLNVPTNDLRKRIYLKKSKARCRERTRARDAKHRESEALGVVGDYCAVMEGAY